MYFSGLKNVKINHWGFNIMMLWTCWS